MGARLRVLVLHLFVALLVLLWLVPTAGLLVTSFRDKDQIAVSGWWTVFSAAPQNRIFRPPEGAGVLDIAGQHALTGNVMAEGRGAVTAFGIASTAPRAFAAGTSVDLGGGRRLTVKADGQFALTAPQSLEGTRSPRIFYTASFAPRLTFDNYKKVLGSAGLGQAFLNSLTVAIPSTLIPTLVAAFAAYALAWMRFRGRAILFSVTAGLMVVPLQIALIPLLTLYNQAGAVFGFDPRSYMGTWLAHTGFGLPLAIFLLRSHMAALPQEVIDSARIDGANDFQIFTGIVLPLSFPALAGFAVFQFLWTLNDLLVALVFLGSQDDKLVLTGQLVNLMGSHGGQWELLAAAAFVSMIAPIVVFFVLQRHFLRGVLAGSLT